MNLDKIPGQQRIALAAPCNTQADVGLNKYVLGFDTNPDVVSPSDFFSFENGDIQPNLRLTVETQRLRLPDNNRHWPGKSHWAGQVWFFRQSEKVIIPEHDWSARMRNVAHDILLSALGGVGDVKLSLSQRTRAAVYFFKALSEEEERKVSKV